MPSSTTSQRHFVHSKKELHLFFVLAALVSICLTAYMIDIPSTKYRITSGYIDEGTSRDEYCLLEERRRLADKLSPIYYQISRLSGQKSSIDAKWALSLHEVMVILDPRLIDQPSSAWDFSAYLPGMEIPNKTSTGKDRHVCPSVFNVKKGWLMFQDGMDTLQCDYVLPFSSVITVILPARNWPEENTVFVIQQIRKVYNVSIIVITNSSFNFESLGSNIIIHKTKETAPEGIVLNESIEKVITPFVFIGKNLSHFNNQSSLERLVRVLDDINGVAIAGGAARNLQGHWQHGCLQQKESFYQASYKLGYYYSKHECMYCDDLLGPFVTKTDILKKVKFDNDLNGPLIYRDWFLNIRKTGYLALVCPDVMFFIENHTTMIKNDWQPFAKKWKYETIRSYCGNVTSFTCSELNIKCPYRATEFVASFLLPKCCIEKIVKQLRYVFDYGDQHGFEYQLQCGNNLGAVKIGDYLPWDLDSDLLIDCKNYKNWLNIRSLVKQAKCSVSEVIKNKYFTINCPVAKIELFCHNYISNTFLPSEYRNISTKILYHGQWVKVNANPGLFGRNQYGFEDLRHSQHWIYQKQTKESKERGGYLNPGVWNKKCTMPSSHQCIDHYPADGNLPFIDPPW